MPVMALLFVQPLLFRCATSYHSTPQLNTQLKQERTSRIASGEAVRLGSKMIAVPLQCLVFSITMTPAAAVLPRRRRPGIRLEAKVLFLVLLVVLIMEPARAFVQHDSRSKCVPSKMIRNTRLFAKTVQEQQQQQQQQSDIAKLQQEAARMRLEADKMDWELTNSKLQTLQEKVEKLRKQNKDPSQQAESIQAMERQIEQLQQKLSDSARTAGSVGGTFSKSTNRNDSKRQQGGSPVASVSTTPAIRPPEVRISSNAEVTAAATEAPAVVAIGEKQGEKTEQSTANKSPSTIEDDGWVVFDEGDLDLYLPVAQEIEERLIDATADEKLEAFRTSPELQTHFQGKIAQLIVEPMQDMQKLESLQSKYLASNSVREKEQLKRQIDKLSKTMQQDSGRFRYSDSVYRNIPPLSEERIQERIETLQSLPLVLQTLYKKRYQLESNSTDVRLAILLDHYESQMQLLDQVKMMAPIGEKMRGEVVEAVDSLPLEIRDRMAEGFQLDKNSYDTEALVKEITKEEEQLGVLSNWSPLSQVVMEAMEMQDSAEYNDIAFVDRSRYVDEFYPSVARLEKMHPSEEEINVFATEFIDRKSFMVTSKPERVIGGWYIRGRNLIDEEDESSGVKLMEQLQQRVNNTALHYFYIHDPSPLTDEEVELGYRNDPLILVTANDPSKFYNYADKRVKGCVSALGIFSVVVFALGVCVLEPALQEKLNMEIDKVNAGGIVDISWLFSIASEVMLSMTSIQVAHEAGHRLIAWRDKFDLGLPTPVPSIQLGSLGTITPLKSPPPSLKSMFDFGVAGPLFGMVASIAFLVQGLSVTSSLDLNQAATLPVLPSELLQASALGGGLIEAFLGRGALIQGTSTGFLALHPFAIAGFVGLLTNALALLPLGNTDGGRVALAMFGRRGAYIVKTFTTSLLCLAGLFGFDRAGVLLTYVLFVVIWQRELEAPARNEVEELDFVRGASGIAMAIFVFLALLPMQ